MKRQCWLSLALLLIFTIPTYAQININVPMTVPPYGLRYLPQAAPVAPEAPTALLRLRPFDLTPPEIRGRDGWRWLDVEDVLAAGLHIATAGDVDSTFRGLERPGVREGNPVLRPVVNAGPELTYAVAFALSEFTLSRARRARQSERPVARALWWLPPIAALILHSYAIEHNNAIASRR